MFLSFEQRCTNFNVLRNLIGESGISPLFSLFRKFELNKLMKSKTVNKTAMYNLLTISDVYSTKYVYCVLDKLGFVRLVATQSIIHIHFNHGLSSFRVETKKWWFILVPVIQDAMIIELINQFRIMQYIWGYFNRTETKPYA